MIRNKKLSNKNQLQSKIFILQPIQEQLAEILKVSRQSVSKWECDAAYPNTEKVIRIGKIFDCSLDYLLKDEFEQMDVNLAAR